MRFQYLKRVSVWDFEEDVLSSDKRSLRVFVHRFRPEITPKVAQVIQKEFNIL